MSTSGGRRERLRAATMQQLRTAALAELREHGAVELSLRSVARRMGMSPAGLYRYVDSREELLTTLISHSYQRLGSAVGSALEEVRDRDVADQLRAVAHAYRDWSVSHPEEFGLLFGDPIPGYAAPPGGPTVDAMTGFGLALAEPLVAAWQQGRVTAPPAVWPDLADRMAPLAEVTGDAPPEVSILLLLSWGRLHGQISLEVFGHHAWAFPDGCRELYSAEVELFLRQLGIVDDDGAAR